MTTAIYARTSTDRQEREETIRSQLDACDAFAIANGLGAVERFVDNGVSGSQLQRPALDELRNRARIQSIRTIVVYDVDRLSRSLGHLLLLMEEFGKAGIDVRFVRSPLEDSAEGRVLFNIKGVFAEYEREKIRERTLRGKTRYIKDGGWFGPPPYGYRVENHHLEVDEQEAPWLRNMFSLYACGAHTLHSLAAFLNQKGVRTRRSDNRRQGWQAEIISRILKRELYTGTFRRELKGIPESACEVEVPALIDPQVFGIVQARLSLNRSDAERNRIHFYLLSGLIRCGACDHRYHGRHVKGTNRRYYRCETNHSRQRYPEPCRSPGIRADVLEATVWDLVVHLVTQPEAMLLGERMLTDGAAEAGTSNVEEQLIRIQRGIRKVDVRKSRVLDVLVDRPQDKHILVRKLQQLDREVEQLTAQEKCLMEELQNAASLGERLAEIRETFKTLRPRLDRLDQADRRQVCQLLIHQIRISRDGQVRVEWMIPTSGKIPNNGDAHGSSSFLLPRRHLSSEARANLSVKNREAMLRRVAAGLYVSPTKDPRIAKKVSEALSRRVREGTWKPPPAPRKDPVTGRWVKGRVSSSQAATPST
ncbi:MAG TPA: recombinase family protein [Candidatus Solibacter sp.]|jgi:site-specific DNA recombinase|nr:recombinase family protein [Candidatus Solibacter sp.]